MIHKNRASNKKYLKNNTCHKTKSPVAQLDLAGFYYDKDKNRYFPINTNNHTKPFSEYLNDETIKLKLSLKNNKDDINYDNKRNSVNKCAHFITIRQSKTLASSRLKSIIFRSILIQNAYRFCSYDDLRSNKMLVYKHEYIVYKDNALFNQFGSVISSFKLNDYNFLKKLYVNINNTPIDKIDIMNDKHLVFYQDWSITFMLYPSFISWLESSIMNHSSVSNTITISLTQPFSFLKYIRNKSSLSVEFDWPLIKESNYDSHLFYCLIYQSFYIIKASNEYGIEKHRNANDALFISNIDLLNQTELVSVKSFNQKTFANFIITNNDNDLWLFEINGSIFKYALSTYKPLMKIMNDYISIITFTYQFAPCIHLLMTENHNLLAFNIKTNEILVLYLSKHSYYIQLAYSNKLWYSHPYCFFQNENRELVQYSMEIYDIVNVFPLDQRRHHRLTLDSSSVVILELSL